MINVIQCTFHIKIGKSLGTAFAIDRNGKQYLVTARHVVEGIANDKIKIFHEQQWKNLSVGVVGTGEDEIDVAVLACPIQLVSPWPIQLARPWPLEASADGLTHGQPVYFLGFPFGWDGGLEKLNRNFPVPFVKAGIVSAITGEAPQVIYIDGHGNAGFSGGPVVFVPNGRPPNELRVAGIVSHYPLPLLEPIVNIEGSPIVDQCNKPIAYIQENPGFVVASMIRHATDLIDANPIGFELPIDRES